MSIRHGLKQFVFDHYDMIDWEHLSANPNAIHLLEQNLDKISWCSLSGNPSIFEIDYGFYTERCNVFKEELIQKVYHPRRVMRYFNEYNYDIHKDVYNAFDE